MRKNGINRELNAIEGGICAPDGFKAGAVACGIRSDNEMDLALIIAEKKCRTACVYSTLGKLGAPSVITRKHLFNGLAQAVLVNGGIANVFMENGEKLADAATRLIEKNFSVSFDDVVIASTGEVGKPLTLLPFEAGVPNLRYNIGNGEEYSLAAAQAISSVGETPKQMAFAFDLGAYPCKIGVICKGDIHVAPNMATTLVFITTDVNISTEMLQRALAAEVRETLNMLSIDGVGSPNDMVCIMSSCRAGNYIIDCVDTEYEKFVIALRFVLRKVCRAIVENSVRAYEKPFYCQVSGCKSKQESRAISKKLIENKIVKHALLRQDIDVEGILLILSEFDAIKDSGRVEISLRSGIVQLSMYENGRKQACLSEIKRELLSAGDTMLCVRIGSGNYSSIAYGTALRESFGKKL